MAESDDYVRNTLTSILQPGEVILSMGWMAPCASGWRDQYDRYFAAGTNARLIVIQTSKSMGTIPKLKNDGITWIDYASMQQVGTRRFSALSDNLIIKGTSGEKAYCVPSPTIIGAKAMDGHAQFNEQYLLWLARHVAAGSFQSAAGAHAAAAEWQNVPAMNDVNIQFAPRSAAAARRRNERRIKWPYLLGLAVMFLFIFAGAKSMGDSHGRSAEERAKMIIFTGFGLTFALFILGIVLNIKRRAADAAAAKAPVVSRPTA